VAKEDFGDARLLHVEPFLDLVQVFSKGELQRYMTILFSMKKRTELGLPKHLVGQRLLGPLFDGRALCLCHSISTI
jgi:hypothetical protein